MYSQEKIDVALKVYHQCRSVSTTIRVLGYPTRRALYTWIAKEGAVKLGESIKSVSEDISYTRASIYSWRKKYLHGGIIALINDKNIKPDTLTEGSPSTASAPDLAQLQAQIRDMQMEIDVLKETINV